MPLLQQPYTFYFFYHKSATSYQIISKKVSISMVKPDLCNRVRIETIDTIAPPQQPHKLGTSFWGIVQLGILFVMNVSASSIIGERKQNDIYFINTWASHACVLLVVSSCFSWLSSASLPQLKLLIHVCKGPNSVLAFTEKLN